jgi:hypothetical protein
VPLQAVGERCALLGPFRCAAGKSDCQSLLILLVEIPSIRPVTGEQLTCPRPSAQADSLSPAQPHSCQRPIAPPAFTPPPLRRARASTLPAVEARHILRWDRDGFPQFSDCALVRAGRWFNPKLPKPRISTRSPRDSERSMAPRISFTAISASFTTRLGKRWASASDEFGACHRPHSTVWPFDAERYATLLLSRWNRLRSRASTAQRITTTGLTANDTPLPL